MKLLLLFCTLFLVAQATSWNCAFDFDGYYYNLTSGSSNPDSPDGLWSVSSPGQTAFYFQLCQGTNTTPGVGNSNECTPQTQVCQQDGIGFDWSCGEGPPVTTAYGEPGKGVVMQTTGGSGSGCPSSSSPRSSDVRVICPDGTGFSSGTVTFVEENPTCTYTVALYHDVGCANVEGVSKAEYDALVDFYSALNGAQWDDNENWMSGDPCNDQWFGVSCSSSQTSHVIALVLDKNNLDGYLPTTLGNLFDLDSMTLSVNGISSTIPTEVVNLRSLTLMDLSHNSLFGSIPTELGELVQFSLDSLNFSFNQLSGLVPDFFVTDSNDFVSVDLSNNNFLCPIPEGAEYTQATCIQVSVSYISTKCFNNPFDTTGSSVYGVGFDGIVDPVCLFELEGKTTVAQAIVDSPTLLSCAQPFLNFSGCTGNDGERMVGSGTFSVGAMNGGQYAAVSNSLPINALNPLCPYGSSSTATAQVNGTDILSGGGEGAFAYFSKLQDVLPACQLGNQFPIKCPSQLNGSPALPQFDATCDDPSSCMWAELTPGGSVQYCPWLNTVLSPTACSIDNAIPSQIFEGTPCFGFTLVEQ